MSVPGQRPHPDAHDAACPIDQADAGALLIELVENSPILALREQVREHLEHGGGDISGWQEALVAVDRALQELNRTTAAVEHWPRLDCRFAPGGLERRRANRLGAHLRRQP